MSKFFYFLFTCLILISCEKSQELNTNIVSNDAIQLRAELQKDGYTETIVDSISKVDCYFDEWEKNVLTPVSGLIEFHDNNDNWVASIDFANQRNEKKKPLSV